MSQITQKHSENRNKIFYQITFSQFFFPNEENLSSCLDQKRASIDLKMVAVF